MLKSDSNTGVFCEYCKIFKNAYFEEHPQTTASDLRKLPVFLLYSIQIYMSVLVTYVALTGEVLLIFSKMLHSVRMWLKSQYLISEEDVEVLEMWNVILTKFDICLYKIWYTYYLWREVLIMLVIPLLYSKTLIQIPVNTRKSKQNVRIFKSLNYASAKANTLKVF